MTEQTIKVTMTDELRKQLLWQLNLFQISGGLARLAEQVVAAILVGIDNGDASIELKHPDEAAKAAGEDDEAH